MGIVFGRRPRDERLWGVNTVGELIPPRTLTGPTAPLAYVDGDRALQHSAVWACLRLRADLISTLPIDVFRKVNLTDGQPPMQIEAPTTPLLVSPGGDRVGIGEWLYMSQVELDRSGNAIGLIRSTDGAGYPLRIDLQASASCTVRVRDGEVSEYYINGKSYAPEVVWHERQYPLAGLPVGLSPVAYAAYTLSEYVSIRDFVTSWFAGGAVPRARLKNNAKKLKPLEALTVKESWRASIAMGEPFVHGSDWDYELIQADHASADWLEGKRFSAVDVARFFGCPADLIDAAVSGQSVTYANITERNLQFLIMHLGPAIKRREDALTAAIPRPRFVKLNSDALMRMDAMSRAQFIQVQIESRVLAPSEARKLDNRPPFTKEQINEFDELGLNKKVAAGVPEPANAELPAAEAGTVPTPGSPNAEPPKQPGGK